MTKLLGIMKIFYLLLFTTKWSEIHVSDIQKLINSPYESGKEFTSFLKNGGYTPVTNENILLIDRSTPFDPKIVEAIDEEIASSSSSAKMSSYDWSIEEEDQNSTKLHEIDLNKVRLVSMLKIGEEYISSSERIRRIKKAGYIRLDAKIFQTVMENLNCLPDVWKEVDGKAVYICFDGTVLLKDGGEYLPSESNVLCLYHSTFKDHWYWFASMVIVPNIYGEDRGIHNRNTVSAVLIP